MVGNAGMTFGGGYILDKFDPSVNTSYTGATARFAGPVRVRRRLAAWEHPVNRRCRPCVLAVVFLVALAAAPAAQADALDDLSRDFWTWRARQQPVVTDDIPRIERPVDWVPDWSPATIAKHREALQAFEARYAAIRPEGWPVNRLVDHRLVGSALARVRWELDIVRTHRRNPVFYVVQTLGSIYDVLLPPPPIDDVRTRQVVLRLQNIPHVLDAARQNLDEARQPFAKLAIGELEQVRQRVETVVKELTPFATGPAVKDLGPAAAAAITALEQWRGWLQERLPTMATDTAIGRERYQWFLDHVALSPYTPDQLLTMGRQEWERAVAFEAYEINRNRGLPELPIFPSVDAHLKKQLEDEAAVRRFIEEKRLLTIPAWVRRYKNLLLPGYLAPLTSMGVSDDMTGPSRREQDGVHYIRRPARDLPYFYLSMARDPRGIIVHEGIPGHYLQLVLSWAHENPIRRFYYDSGSNEGIGFYAEEMMLQAGLFDNLPRSREIIYNFMRLRALRVEVDVRLATGEFTIEQGADYLARTVPMDRATALEESAMFAATPGQAITYQIGKLQILRMLADGRRQGGAAFDMRAFHDFVWKNGNVPLSLQRWELLGLRDDVDAIDRRAVAGLPQH